MKPLALLPLALVPAAFVVGGLFGPVPGAATTGANDAEPLTRGLAPVPAAPSVERFDALASNVEQLLFRVESLEAELAGLRSAALRRPVEAAAEAAEAAPVVPAAAALQAPAREAILTVLAEEEERKAQERRERAEQRAVEQTLERARKLAEYAGVDAGGEKILADLLIAQRTRYQDLRTSLEDVPRQDRKEALRAGVEELAAWRTEQLNTYFDANVAARLQKPLAKSSDAGKVEKKKEPAPRRQQADRKRDK